MIGATLEGGDIVSCPKPVTLPKGLDDNAGVWCVPVFHTSSKSYYWRDLYLVDQERSTFFSIRSLVT